MRPLFSWSLTLVTCPPSLVFNTFGHHVATHLATLLVFNNAFKVPCCPLSWPIVIAHPPTNSHLHSCSMHVRLSLIQTWLGLTPTRRPLTFVSCPPCYVSCSVCPTHLVRSQSGLTCAHTSRFPACMPLTCASCPPPNISSPVHPAHLVRSWWISPHVYASHLCILPTSLCLLPHVSCPPH